MADSLATVTDDGVLLASNHHGHPNEPHLLRWRPAADGAHAVLLSRPWWGEGADAGANEHGVAITAQPVATRRAGARPEGALPGGELARRALERSLDRREAVEVLTRLLEEHGQDAPPEDRAGRAARDTSFLVADPRGVTLLETAGRQWATEEVVGSRSVSAGLTIEDFAARFAARGRGRTWRVAERRARTGAAAAAAAGPADLFAALRGHGSARPPDLPRFRRRTGALRGACAHAGGLVTTAQTTASWVSDLRPGRPRQQGATAESGTHWVTGTAAPCTSIFWPAAVGVPAPVDRSASVGPREDPASLWWRHERVHRAALCDADRTLDPLATGRDVLETLWLAGPPRSADALEAAEDWRGAALDGLRALEPADTRPVRVAVQWRRWNARAGLPAWAGLASEGS